VVAAAAAEDLNRLIVTHRLPSDTRERVTHLLRPLALFPLLGLGPVAGGRWGELRFIVDPWRWMVTVYASDEPAARVSVVAIQDGRSARAPRPTGSG
jgi:hypothetical protein